MLRILFVVQFFIQACFAVHALKSGRDQKWLWIILMFPVVGCIAYYFLEVFPNSSDERKLRQGIRDIAKTLNPDKELRQKTEALSTNDSVDNRAALADECLNKGMFDDAVKLYDSCLTGPFADDPALSFSLARAHFYNENFPRAQVLLEKLSATKIKFRPNDVKLLLARTLGVAGQTNEALSLFEQLKTTYVGFEARYYYGLLLKRLGQETAAREHFEHIVTQAKRNRNAKDMQKEWINLAQAELEGRGS
jgi:hypothetical protein